MQCHGAELGHGQARAALALLPVLLEHIGMDGGNAAQQRLPLLALTHHHRLAGMRGGRASQAVQQRVIEQWRVARHHQQKLVPGHGKPCANAGVGAGETALVVLHQPVGEGRVQRLVAVAGDDQIVRHGAGQALQMLNHRFSVPFDQTLVAAAHAPALTTGEQQDRTGGQGVGSSHGALVQHRKKGPCDITPVCFPYNWTKPMKAKADTPFVPLNIAVLTVSDTRTFENDTSGQMFVDRLTAAGHGLIERVLLKDDLYKIRAQVATWIANDDVQVVLITGGTGFTGRDSTPEAVACLLDKQVDGFGELFRQISVPDIGSSTIQSRALAGLANGTLVCCLPGSTNAVRTGWDGILADQLNNSFRPCNFVPHLKKAEPCATRG